MKHEECPLTDGLATRYATGDSSFLDRWRFAIHRRRCRRCSAAVNEMSQALACLARLEPPSLPPAAVARLQTAARHQLAADRSYRQSITWRLVVRRGLSAAAVAAALLLLVLWLPRKPADPGSTPGAPGPGVPDMATKPLLQWEHGRVELEHLAAEIDGLRVTSASQGSGLHSHEGDLESLRARVRRLHAAPQWPVHAPRTLDSGAG